MRGVLCQNPSITDGCEGKRAFTLNEDGGIEELEPCPLCGDDQYYSDMDSEARTLYNESRDLAHDSAHNL